jgi:hypothetical protein
MCVFADVCGIYDPQVVRHVPSWARLHLRRGALLTHHVNRKRPHRQRVVGRCLLSVVVVGHEADVADLVMEPGRDDYHKLADLRRGHSRPLPRVRCSTTACLKPITALCRRTCHGVIGAVGSRVCIDGRAAEGCPNRILLSRT